MRALTDLQHRAGGERYVHRARCSASSNERSCHWAKAHGGRPFYSEKSHDALLLSFAVPASAVLSHVQALHKTSSNTPITTCERMHGMRRCSPSCTCCRCPTPVSCQLHTGRSLLFQAYSAFKTVIYSNVSVHPQATRESSQQMCGVFNKGTYPALSHKQINKQASKQKDNTAR